MEVGFVAFAAAAALSLSLSLTSQMSLSPVAVWAQCVFSWAGGRTRLFTTGNIFISTLNHLHVPPSRPAASQTSTPRAVPGSFWPEVEADPVVATRIPLKPSESAKIKHFRSSNFIPPPRPEDISESPLDWAPGKHGLWYHTGQEPRGGGGG